MDKGVGFIEEHGCQRVERAGDERCGIEEASSN
jgi:hypothetical protein